MSDVRVLATRVHGDGTESFIDNEVPMAEVVVTPNLNAGAEITGTIAPSYLRLIGEDGKPVMEAWSTALYVEVDGEIVAGGIIADDSYDDQTRTMTTVGFADYPAGQAYVGSWVSTALDQAKQRERAYPTQLSKLTTRHGDALRDYNNATAAWNALPGGTPGDNPTRLAKRKAEQRVGTTKLAYDRATRDLDNLMMAHGRDVATLAMNADPSTPTFTDGVDGVDPLDILRHIWNHLQSFPRGNLGMIVDNTASPVRLGRSIEGTVYDTDNDGDTPPFEYGEYRLAWYETTDLGEKVSELVENTPFQFWEEHSWNEERTAIVHRLRLAYPRAGSKRDDVRFTIGENVEIPQYANEGASEYASGLLGLGAGEGGTDITANDSGRVHTVIERDGEHRIRRILSFDDPSRASVGTLSAAIRAELKSHNADYVISALTTIPGTGRDLEALRIGDWVRTVGDVGWREIDQWYRITSITYSPEEGATLSFGVEPVN